MSENINKSGDSAGNAAIDRAMKILDYLYLQEKCAGVSKIANDLVLPKASVFRILNTLEEWNAVECSSEGYRLGKIMLKYGQKVASNINGIDLFKPVMSKIVAEVNETVNLGALYGANVCTIFSMGAGMSVLSPRQMPMSPLYCSSMGKAFLAYCDDEYIREYFSDKSIVRRTENTVVSYEAFAEQRAQILDGGFSFDDEEYELGLYCISVPVVDKHNTIKVALGVSGPKSRLVTKESRIKELLQEAKHSVEDYVDLVTFI